MPKGHYDRSKMKKNKIEKVAKGKAKTQQARVEPMAANTPIEALKPYLENLKLLSESREILQSAKIDASALLKVDALIHATLDVLSPAYAIGTASVSGSSLTINQVPTPLATMPSAPKTVPLPPRPSIPLPPPPQG